MNNLVIGSAFDLSWEQCRVWVNSLNASGFTGDKILVYFGTNLPLFEKLRQHGILIAAFPSLSLAHNVCVTRFGAYNAILRAEKRRNYDWVIATDVTDVVFQKNPDDYFSRVSNNTDLVASSENLVYKDEPWGKNNLILSFGEEQFLAMANNTIYNAGVIAARHAKMADISQLIYQLSVARTQHVFGGGGPDQAAYNFILSLPTMNENTRVSYHDEGWACQCGTNLDPSKPHYNGFHLNPIPTFDGENVINSTKEPYFIVHQYNRVPELKEYYERKYNV